MFKGKKKKDKYEGLHGQELIDAIMRDGTFGKPITESQAKANDVRIEQLNRRYEREAEIKEKVSLILKPVFFTPLSIMFHVLTVISRIVGAITSVALPFAIYFTYKYISEWRTIGVCPDGLRFSVAALIFPFIAFGMAALFEKLWCFFEDNRY